MAAEMVFYDGDCGLCHRSVRFLLEADRDGRCFRFAPIQGETFREAVDAGVRGELPDSLIVLTERGSLLTRSDATIHLLRRLSNPWRALGVLLALVPRPLRDVGYDFVARIRRRLFATPQDQCPAPSPGTRARFDP
jgi:predicted DCC family thiol-disulfide oxidoreductase YuxK